MVISPQVASHSWEIWVGGPGGYRERVDLCGLCGSPDDAESLRNAVREWLHREVWGERLDRLPPDDRDELRALRTGFRASGVDFATLRVSVRVARLVGVIEAPTDEFGRVIEGKRAARVSFYDPTTDDGDDDGDDDTVTLPPEDVYLVYDLNGDVR